MEFGGSWSSFFMYLQYSTVAQICCTCAVVNKNIRRKTGTRRDTHHGHKECQGTYHGHLKAAHWGAKNTRLLLRSKHIAPKPRIARAPELVFMNSILRGTSEEDRIIALFFLAFSLSCNSFWCKIPHPLVSQQPRLRILNKQHEKPSWCGVNACECGCRI